MSRVFRFSSKLSLVTGLYILSILIVWFESASGTPAVVAAAAHLLDTKEDQPQLTTTHDKDLIEQFNCDLSKSNLLRTEATMALFYVDQSNFILIAIDPYDVKYFGDLISYTSKKFNRTKLYELYQVDVDYAGLVRVLKVNDKITLNLEGQSPGSKECVFKVSRYLCTQEAVPIADYLLFESVMYPGHYMRRYDDKITVDCEPEQSTTPTDTTHFYWRASKTLSPADSGNEYVQLLSSHDHNALTFSNDTAFMYVYHNS